MLMFSSYIIGAPGHTMEGNRTRNRVLKLLFKVTKLKRGTARNITIGHRQEEGRQDQKASDIKAPSFTVETPQHY